MPFPTDPKERQKIFLLAGIGVAFLGYATFMFGIKPMNKAKKENAEKTEVLDNKVNKARKDMALVAVNEQKNLNTMKKLMELSDNYVLPPRLGGNFKLGADEKIDAWASKAKITVKNVSEIGLTEIPSAKGAHAFRSYNVRVSVSCGYNEFKDFLKIIEADNPLLCVTGILISGQKNPEFHQITFDLQWPVWSNNNIPEKLRDQINNPTTGI